MGKTTELVALTTFEQLEEGLHLVGVLLEADEKVVVPEDRLQHLWRLSVVWCQRLLDDGRGRQNPLIQHLMGINRREMMHMHKAATCEMLCLY